MNVSIQNRRLLAQQPGVLKEFEQLMASLAAWGSIQHNDDGSHGDLTATSLLLTPGSGPFAIDPAFRVTGGLSDIGGGLACSGVLTPPQITADQNDYSPLGIQQAFCVRMSSDAARNITGLMEGPRLLPYSGRLMVLVNAGSFNITLKNASTLSQANFRFSMSGAVDAVLAPGAAAILYYDFVAARWVPLYGIAAVTTPTPVPTDTLAISHSTPVGTQALSTLGTIDWFAAVGNIGDPAVIAPANSSAVVRKRLGSRALVNNFELIRESAAITTNTSGITYTATAADSINASAVSTATGVELFLAAGGTYGWRLAVPTTGVLRHLVMMVGSKSCSVTTTARMTGAVTQTLTDVITGGAGVQRVDLVQIDYKSAVGGGELVVMHQISATLATTPLMLFHFAYISE